MNNRLSLEPYNIDTPPYDTGIILSSNSSLRFQYEFKARGVKKSKVSVDVSIDGVRVTAKSKAVGKVCSFLTSSTGDQPD